MNEVVVGAPTSGVIVTLHSTAWPPQPPSPR